VDQPCVHLVFYLLAYKTRKGKLREHPVQQTKCAIVPKELAKFFRFPITSNIAAQKKLIAQFNCKALFSSEKISDFGIVAFSFLFDKYYPIMD